MIRHFNLKNFGQLWKTIRREGVGVAFIKSRNYLKNNRALKAEIHQPVDASLVASYTAVDLPIPPQTPDVSIIIPVFNNWLYTYNCILSIPGSCSEYSYEVIIADDGSSDETTKSLEIFKNCRVVKDGTNRRFLRNCNNAAAGAKGRYLYFLNNDTKLLAGAIDRLVEYQEKNQKTGITGSKLIYPDGSLQEAGCIVWSDGSAWNYGRFHNRDSSEYNFVREVDYVSGASLLVRHKLWRELNGFDDSFSPAYCEDSDLCMQARNVGYSTVYIPKSVVIHYEGKSNGTSVSDGQKKYQLINMKRLAHKWRQTLSDQHYSSTRMTFLARNRATLNNPVVLVVDHYVPQYDRDAGSRSMWSYMMSIKATGAVVIFLTDNFLPLQPYTSELEDMGIQVLYGKRYSEHWQEWLAENGQFIDMVFLSRPHIAPKYLPALRKYSSAKIVYYGHDLHYLREQRRLAVTGIEGARTIDEIKREELALMSLVDVAISCSTDETEILKRDLPGKDVRYVPLYSVEPIQPESSSNRSGLLFVGSFGHPPNADGLLWFLQRIFPIVVKQMPDIVLNIVGSNPPSSITAFASKNVVVHGRVSDTELRKLYSTCMVCVIPLRYGAGVKGKLVEAMAHGVPVVTTPIGIEGLPRIMRHCALVSQDEGIFSESILAVYRDAKLRERLVALGLRSIKKWFSCDVLLKFWSDLISELVPIISRMKKWNVHYSELSPSWQKTCPLIRSISPGKVPPRIIFPPIGYYEDGWCAPYFSIELGLESNDPVTITFEIWIPDQASGSIRIESIVNGLNARVTDPPKGVSTIVVEHVHPINCNVSIFIKSSSWNLVSPSAQDKRELSFILRKIEL